jgi:hypothetical protein
MTIAGASCAGRFDREQDLLLSLCALTPGYPDLQYEEHLSGCCQWVEGD